MYTVFESASLIISFCNKHNLNMLARKNLVKLINAFLPVNNSLPSYERISSLLLNDKNVTNISYYCCNCKKEKEKKTKCKSPECIMKETEEGEFYSLSIVSQLEKITSHYWEDISKYLNETRSRIDYVDTLHYKNSSDKTVKSDINQKILNLTLCSDGVSIRKNVSIWPVLLTIIELPPLIRESYFSKILVGVWRGNKPSSSILYKKLMKDLNTLGISGIKVQSSGVQYTVKYKLASILCDAPALALSLDMRQFNGYYGCAFCMHPGEI